MTSLKNQNSICAVIPFFNEEKKIHFLVNDTSKYVDLLILVDDGSTDLSSNRIPKSDKVIFLKHPRNLGKGSALKTGLKKSIELKTDLTITLDADYQHDPKFIPEFICKLKEFDCIIGSRKINSSMPIQRKLSNYLTSKLLSLKTGRKILDSQSGFRGFRTNILKNILPNYSGFEAESEMIVKLCQNKLSLGYTEISTLYGDDNSKMKAIPTILGFIKVLLN